MRILHIYDGDGEVGPEHSVSSVVFNLTNCLAEKGHEVTVIERRQNQAPLFEYKNDVKYIRINLKKISKDRNGSGLHTGSDFSLMEGSHILHQPLAFYLKQPLLPTHRTFHFPHFHHVLSPIGSEHHVYHKAPATASTDHDFSLALF